MTTSGTHEQARRTIVAHFTGNFDGAAVLPGGRARTMRREQTMRAHLPGCGECRALYDRFLLAASLDPAAPSDERRLARGLGLPPPRAPARAARFAIGFAGLAAAAALALFVLRPGPAPDGFAARGGGAPAPELAVYRIAAAGASTATSASSATTTTPEPVGDTIRSSDEVAFAYRNPLGRRRLLVFAVDEHRHVFWYHPGWLDPAGDPVSVAISAEPGLHELPAAIAQRYDGRWLAFHALFTDQEVTVRQVEAALAAAGTAGGGEAGAVTAWPFTGAVDVVRSVRVTP